MDIPSIRLTQELDIFIWFCYLLDELGELKESTVSEIALSCDAVSYFELMDAVGAMTEKGLIREKRTENETEKTYCLLDEGRSLARDLSSHIPLSIRERTVSTGRDILKRLDREKAIKCYLTYDNTKKRYDIVIRFLNEINGETILEIKLYAPDSESARQIMERFLSKPAFIIKRTMNMFLEDDFFMSDQELEL